MIEKKQIRTIFKKLDVKFKVYVDETQYKK